MQIRDLLLLAYLAFGGKVSGKTALQKKVYFLSEMLAFGAGYEAHYYGPYSWEVADANSELKSLGYVKESATYWGAINPEGFEVVRYDYQLTEAGQNIAEQKSKRFAQEWQEINSATEKIIQAEENRSLDYMGLAAAAKAYFLLKQKGSPTDVKEIRR